jgi:hypothetical protein
MTDQRLPANADARPDTRRGFLRGLARLPLIGGGITLIGQPTAAAEPISEALLHSYKSWLLMEHRMLSYELAKYDGALAREIERFSFCGNAGERWHFRHEMRDGDQVAGWEHQPQPSTRAAVVLSAVGCSWQEDQ